MAVQESELGAEAPSTGPKTHGVRMALKWKPGTDYQLPDRVSRLPGDQELGIDISDSFPDDRSKSDRGTTGRGGHN